MNEILLNGKEIGILGFADFPMLIHGEDRSGASFYTICLAVKWFLQGNKVIFLCGYPMAQQAFEEQVGKAHDGAVFYTKERVQDFKKVVENKISADALLVIKNVELFGPEEVNLLSGFGNVIISGDLNKSKARDEVLRREFITKIYFSEFEGVDLPTLAKYEGFMLSADHKGITKLEVSKN